MTACAATLRQLHLASHGADFVASATELVDEWEADRARLDRVEAILAFMEDHPELDYGAPGPLVHYVETCHGRGCSRLLTASIRRRPTPHTIWMLNRLINGTPDAETRRTYVGLMADAAEHPEAAPGARDEARWFLDQS